MPEVFILQYITSIKLVSIFAKLQQTSKVDVYELIDTFESIESWNLNNLISIKNYTLNGHPKCITVNLSIKITKHQ